MSFLIVSAAIGAGSALYGVGKSISQSNQASKIDKNNPRPDYAIPDEFTQNVRLAKQMAQVGLPQQQYNSQVNAINRNQAGAIGALSNSANPGANLASIVRGGDDANNTLNAQDAAARQNNERYYIGQNSQLGQQKLDQQQYNKFDKYTEDYNKSAALRGAAAQNLQNGINGAAGVATDLYGVNQMNSGTQQTMGAKLGNPTLSAQSGYSGNAINPNFGATQTNFSQTHPIYNTLGPPRLNQAPYNPEAPKYFGQQYFNGGGW